MKERQEEGGNEQPALHDGMAARQQWVGHLCQPGVWMWRGDPSSDWVSLYPLQMSSGQTHHEPVLSTGLAPSPASSVTGRDRFPHGVRYHRRGRRWDGCLTRGHMEDQKEEKDTREQRTAVFRRMSWCPQPPSSHRKNKTSLTWIIN